MSDRLSAEAVGRFYLASLAVRDSFGTGIESEQDQFAVGRRSKESDGHDGPRLIGLRKGNPNLVEPGFAVVASDRGGDVEILAHVDFLSFSMQ